MNVDAKDRILDAGLEEVLGGQSPPDFTARIMQALGSSGATATENPASGNGTAPARSKASPGLAGNLPAVRPIQPRAKRCRRNKFLNVALAASILAAALSVGVLVFQLVDRGQDKNESIATPGSGAGVAEESNERGIADGKDVVPPIKDGTLVDRREFGHGTQAKTPAEKPVNHEDNVEQRLVDSQSSPDAEVVALINDKLQEGWQRFSVEPTKPVDDETWCRRLFEKLMGRQPAGDELDAFLANSSEDKRELLVDRLLSDPAYSGQFARRFAAVWSDLLIGPAGGRRQGDLANRSGLEQYLRQSFADNKPLDELARELISATGSGKPGAEDFNGATNFLLAHLDRQGSTATAHVGRVFLGQRIKCAQCHDHLDGGQHLAQSDFWRLNAFFRQVDFERRSNSGEFALVDRDFVGEGDDPYDAEVYFETPEGRLKVAYPVLDGKAIATSGFVEDVNRREELAKLITESAQFDRTLVNNVWKSFFVYDLPSDSRERGELVDALASELRAGGFDSKRLARWIVLSDAFSLSSEIPSTVDVDQPEFGGMALFSRFYQRTVKAEPVTTGLASAAKAFEDGSVAARQSFYGSFSPQDPSSDSIVAPELVAPIAVSPSINLDDRELIRKISTTKELAFDDQVKHLFWATVTRNPTERELKLARELHNANNKNSFEALEAIWLVLTNSDEFISE